MLRSHYCSEVDENVYGRKIRIAGWVEDIRNLGGIAFIIIRDRTGRMQITSIKKENPEIFNELTSLTRESVVSASGTCQKNEKVMNGWELMPEKIHVFSKAETPLPMGIIDKVNVDFDTRLDNRIIDLRRDKVKAIFMIRHSFIGYATEFLRKNGFIEVHTPKISSAPSEGGTEVFKISYFDRDAYLVQSPQLYKQMLMASGLDKVYEIAWYFRAEEHDTSRHLNESTAIDMEMAFIEDEEDVMKIAECMTDYAVQKILDENSKEIEILNTEVDMPSLPYPRISYDEVVEILQKEIDFKWGDDLGTDEENLLAQKLDYEIYFIKSFPLEAKPFYAMPSGKYARAFDLEYKGIEIASGAQRIHEYDMLIKRMEEKGMNIENFSDYLKAFQYGMPPHGGYGYGIERFLMRLLNLRNIRECILFPRDRKRLRP
ncbi:MAG TPA: aspartate--tRNA(Asn) ligase [Thermoplasmatales archaeon]|nr:aspartate--tRNA(Asn) ligase [Thermoplasmatales archaeon]